MSETAQPDQIDRDVEAVIARGPKFPEVGVQLVGLDGNAFSILGRVIKAMRRGGCSAEDVLAFEHEATSGDYNKLLQTVMATVTCDACDEADLEDDE